MAKNKREVISVKNTERIVTFSDGVIAVAITLLVLQLPIPLKVPNRSLSEDIVNLIPIMTSYIISFLVIAKYWLKHLSFNNYIKRYNMSLIWLNFFYLLTITFIPFPTAIYGTHSSDKLALILYASTIAIAGYISYLMCVYAMKHPELLEEDVKAEELKHVSYITLIMPTVFVASIFVGLFYPSIVPIIWVLFGIGSSFLHRLY
jgi:uncharacterized membrane protein